MKSKKLEKIESIVDALDAEDEKSGKFKYALSDVQETPDGTIKILRSVNQAGKWFTAVDIEIRP